MRSMTGFGQGSATGDRLRVTATARTVNHRFLDQAIRLKEDRPATEKAIRDLVETQLHRGRLDMTIEVESEAGSARRIRVDEALLGQVQDLVDDMSGRGLVSRDVHLADLLRVPDLIRTESAEVEWQDDDEATVLSAVEEALASLVTAREEEGAKLRSMLLERIDGLEELLAGMRGLAASQAESHQEKLRERLEKLLGAVPEAARTVELDEQRLAQEVAVLADRTDIVEELDRLGAHLQQVREVVDQDGSLGKRLDFLAQEIFRELNTIGSKCRESEVTRHVVDGKVLCEQLREQVQNVE